MDKGIRKVVNAKFKELLPQLAELGGRRFRAEVRFYAIEQFGCTGSAASTHYNYAFQECKKSNPELVIGLGRPPEKNNGGRKKKVTEVAEAVMLLLGHTPSNVTTEAAVDATVDATVETDAAEAAEEDAVDDNDAGETAPEQTVFTVKKKATGEVVAEGLTFDDAKELVAKAKAAKKSALYYA